MRSLSRRQVLRSLVGTAGLAALPTAGLAGGLMGCSSQGEEEPESLDELRSRDEALKGVDKIVILMMENRSFDHYFGHLTMPAALGGEGFARFDPTRDRQTEGDRRINGLTGMESNPKSPGAGASDSVRVFHATPTLGRTIGDINHEWVECHNQWDPIVENGTLTGRGRMDGFIIEHLRDRGELALPATWAGTCGGLPKICDEGTKTAGSLLCSSGGDSAETKLATCGAPDSPMSFYKRQDTPVYHAFLDNFTVCDAWHASVVGPTWPNRYYLHGASAGGAIGTNVKTDRRPNLDTIWNVLSDAKIDAMNFFCDEPLNYIMYGRDTVSYFNRNAGSSYVFDGKSPLSELFKTDGMQSAAWSSIRAIARDKTFEERCVDGDLPPVSFIEPPYFSADDHPPHDISMGQAFVKSVYTMLYGARGHRAQANKTLLVVLYDEHGSFYDHQDPGVAYEQSSGPMDSDEDFRPLGFRVPAMIVGPMVKRAHVSHTVYDHTSVIATLVKWLRLKGHPVRDFQPVPYGGVTHDPNRRIRVARDIGDCLDLDYDGSGRDMIKLPAVNVREVDALATMDFNEGQRGFGDALGIGQPSRACKRDACKVVMEHMYRLGAVNIG
jgi:phospholipase C